MSTYNSDSDCHIHRIMFVKQIFFKSKIKTNMKRLEDFA